MSQVEVPKLNSYVALAPEADAATVTKLNIYVLAVPGDDGGDGGTSRQAHVFAQKIRRA